jgi:MFS superfamily sulfate permease-like transporter
MRGIGWADVPREATAGITLAALIIPLNIGFAQVAGLPPAVGLYSAIVPLLIVALFTTSRHVVGSPDASIAALVGAALLAFAAPGDPLRLQYAGALALMCGLLFFVFWFFRLAFLANFLSRAVLVGFISGLGIEVFTNQVRKILGASVAEGSQVVAAAHQIKETIAASMETEGYLRELYRLRRTEFAIAIVCLLSVLVLGPLKAVMIAFLLSTIDVIRRTSQPGTWVLRESPDGSHFVPTETIGAPDDSGLIIYRFGSPLYFANANLFMEEVEKLVTQSRAPIRAFVLDAEAMSDIDTTGAEVLHQVLSLLADRGVTFAVARANPHLPPLLQRYRLLESIGEKRLYPTNRHAVAALRQEQ